MAAPININTQLFLTDIKNADIIFSKFAQGLGDTLSKSLNTALGNADLSKVLLQAKEINRALENGFESSFSGFVQSLQKSRDLGIEIKDVLGSLPKDAQAFAAAIDRVKSTATEIAKGLRGDVNQKASAQQLLGNTISDPSFKQNIEIQKVFYDQLTKLNDTYTSTSISLSKEREQKSLEIQNAIASGESESQAKIRSESQKTVTQFRKEYEARENLRQTTIGNQNARGFDDNLKDRSSDFDKLRQDIIGRADQEIDIQNKVAKANLESENFKRLEVEKTTKIFRDEFSKREKAKEDILGKQNASLFQENIDSKQTTFGQLRGDIEKRASLQLAKEELAVKLEEGIAASKQRQEEVEQIAIQKELITQRRENLATQKAIAAETSKIINFQDVLRDTVRRADASGVSTPGIEKLRGATLLTPDHIAKSKVGGKSPIDERELSLLNKAELQYVKVAEATKRAAVSTEDFGAKTALAFKRFAAFLVGSAPLFFLIQSFRTATQEALKFEHQVTKIEQVLEITSAEANKIGSAIAQVATQTGTDIDQIAEGVQQLAQAGFKDPAGLTEFAKQIAKVPLAATFDGIGKTTEGLIAIFGQFHKSLGDTAEILDLVNQFAADFAVESKDIFEAVARGGAAFSTAGGDLKEFIGLFSLLRSATRESAETLGNFFKTSVADLLAKKSKQKLTLLGIDTDKSITDQLEQLSGRLIGPNSKLSKQEVIKIAVDLVGTRQFNRFLTLLQELQDPAKRKQIDESLSSASGSLDRAAGKRLDDIGVSFDRIKQSFTEFIVTITQSNGIKKFAKDIADLAVSLLHLAKAITPLLPLMATLASLSLGPKLLGFASGLTGIKFGGRKQVGDINDITPITQLLAINPNANLGIKPTSSRAGNFGKGALLAGILGSAAFTAFGSDNVSGGASGKQIGGLLASATSGGVLGAGVGSIIPGIGTGVGAVVGTLIGSFKGLISIINENTQAEFQRKLALAGPDPIKRIFTINQTNPLGLRGLNSLDTTISQIRGGSERSFQINKVLKELTKEFNGGGVNDAEKARGTDLNKIFNNTVQKVFESLNDDKVAQKLFKINSDQVKFTDIYSVIYMQIKEQLQAAGIDLPSDALHFIDDTLGNSVKEAFDKADIKRGLERAAKQIEEEVDNTFGTIARSVQSIFRYMSAAFLNLDKLTKATNDQLDTISTNPQDLVKAKGSSVDKTLFAQNGFGAINDFNNLGETITFQISRVFNNPDFAKSINKFSKDLGTKSTEEIEGLRATDLLKQALGDNKDTEEAAKILAPLFETISTFSKKSVADIIKELNTGSGSIEEVVKGLLGGQENFSKLADTIRQRYELLNKEAELNKSLSDSIRGLNAQIFETESKIQDLGDVLKDRVAVQANFANRTDSVTANINQAGDLSSRANRTKFGDIDTFGKKILADAQDRNNKVAAAGDLNRKGFAFNDPKALKIFKDSQDAQAQDLNNRQELTQRIADFEKRVGNASAAADLLRATFNELDGQIKSAGQAVTQFGKIDLARSLSAFDKFIGLGGIKNPGKALEGLTSKDFGRIQQLLGAAGNFNLGKGITGNQLLGDINQSLGIPFLAAIKTRVTPGLSQDDAEKQIRDELAAIKQKAADAAALEVNLRTQQLAALQILATLPAIDEKFLSQQVELLKVISERSSGQIAPLEAIRNQMGDIIKAIQQLGGNFSGQQYPITQPITSVPAITTDSIAKPKPRNDDNYTPHAGISNIPPNRDVIGQADILTRIPEEFISMDRNILAIRDTLDKIYDYATNSTSNNQDAGPQATFNLNIAPMQVNVALSAPDILALAGPQLQANIQRAIGAKLSEIFKGDPEIAGKIDSKFGTE